MTSTLAVAAGMIAALAQSPQPPVKSPEVHADRRVTFRLRAPNAAAVTLAREGAERAPMRKDDQGIWTLTTDPLDPDLYGYSFVVDGVSLVDPSNSLTKPNLLNLQSVVHVPGPPSLPWEEKDVPHGVLQHHFYRSAVVGDDRDFFVYTPPGYSAGAAKTYPVLYLLHGFSDDASAWTAVGRANVILDSLIAQGAARPMVIVMPLGYGAPEIVSHGFAGLGHETMRRRNYDKFREALLDEVIPRVEKEYRVSKGRQGRAIAGLSMGGAESLIVGLNALSRFAWIGAFSTGGLAEDFDSEFPAIDAAASSQLRLLWIACGTEDRLIEPNRKLRAWLTAKGIRHEGVETPGAHTWMVWRRNLASFVPLLFTDRDGTAARHDPRAARDRNTRPADLRCCSAPPDRRSEATKDRRSLLRR
jgi:enterochelin esterase family protein